MPNLPQRFIAKVANKKWISPKVLLVDFDLLAPSTIDFSAGQFINLEIDETTFRAYSICSFENQKQTIQIAADAAHDGKGSNYLRNSQIGDKVKFIGPSGRFTLKKTLAIIETLENDESLVTSSSLNNALISPKLTELVFIATGTGIAPFIPMFEKLKNMQKSLKMPKLPKITFFNGIRTETDFIFKNQIEAFSKEIPDFTFFTCISRPADKTYHFNGRITNYFKVENPQNSHIYICGNPNMVVDVIEKLLKLGTPEQNIFHEKFTLAGVV